MMICLQDITKAKIKVMDITVEKVCLDWRTELYIDSAFPDLRLKNKSRHADRANVFFAYQQGFIDGVNDLILKAPDFDEAEKDFALLSILKMTAEMGVPANHYLAKKAELIKKYKSVLHKDDNMPHADIEGM